MWFFAIFRAIRAIIRAAELFFTPHAMMPFC